MREKNGARAKLFCIQIWAQLVRLTEIITPERQAAREGKKDPRNSGGGGRGVAVLEPELTEMANRLPKLETAAIFKVFALP